MIDELFDTVTRKIADHTGRSPKMTGDTASMCCPAHEDTTPSLSVSIGQDRDRVLLHCHAGCTAEQVAAAVGLAMADLFVRDDQPTVPPVTRLPSPPATYDYHDADGTLVGRVHRKPDKRFLQQRADGTWKGFGRYLYRLPQTLEAIAAGRGVFVVEGEKDADRLEAVGLTATCNVGGAGKWTDDYAKHLEGAHVVVVPDNDQAGSDHADTIARSLHGVAASVRVLHLPGLPEHGDVSDWLAAGGTAERLRELANAAPTFDPDAPQVADDRFPPVDWTQLWNGEADEVDWIIDGIIEAGRHAALYAPHKGGKSLLMLEGSAAVAAGDQAVFGRIIDRPRTVLYVDWENAPSDLLSRLKALGRRPDELGRLVYLSLPMLDALDTDTGGDQLLDLARRHGADLVVLDTFSRAVEGPENDADTYRDYYRACGMKLKAAGIAVWRLDHSGKDHTRGQRGSSAKGDDVDAVWKLMPSAGGRLRLKRELTRTLHGIDELALVRRDGSARLHPDDSDGGGEHTADVDEVVAELDQLGVPLDWGRRKAAKALREAGITARNELVGAAVSLRRHRAEQAPMDVVADATKRSPEVVPAQVAGDRSGDRSAGGPRNLVEAVRDRSGTATDRWTGDPPDQVVPTTLRPGRDAVGTGPVHPLRDHPSTTGYGRCPQCNRRHFGDGICHACQTGGAA